MLFYSHRCDRAQLYVSTHQILQSKATRFPTCRSRYNCAILEAYVVHTSKAGKNSYEPAESHKHRPKVKPLLPSASALAYQNSYQGTEDGEDEDDPFDQSY
jgi:hypothetical protein